MGSAGGWEDGGGGGGAWRDDTWEERGGEYLELEVGLCDEFLGLHREREGGREREGEG